MWDYDDEISFVLFSPQSTDMSSALRSVALMCTLDLKTMHCAPKLFSVPSLEEEDPTLSPLDDQDKSTDG